MQHCQQELIILEIYLLLKGPSRRVNLILYSASDTIDAGRSIHQDLFN